MDGQGAHSKEYIKKEEGAKKSLDLGAKELVFFGLFFTWGEVDPVDQFENRGAVLEPPGSKVMVLILISGYCRKST